jgi:hypothetical protein
MTRIVCPTRSAASAMAGVRAGIRCYVAEMRASRVMIQFPPWQPWHEGYPCIGGIPTAISVEVIQIRVGKAGFGVIRTSATGSSPMTFLTPIHR